MAIAGEIAQHGAYLQTIQQRTSPPSSYSGVCVGAGDKQCKHGHECQLQDGGHREKLRDGFEENPSNICNKRKGIG
jgi:hypothetical protein